MEFKVFFKHMDSSLSLYVYAENKILARLEKYELGLGEAHVTFAVEDGVNRVHCHVFVAGGGVTMSVDSDDTLSMYAAVDKLADKLDARMRKQKEKLRSHRQRLTQSPSQAEASVTDAEPEDAIDAAEVLAFEHARSTLHP